MIEFGFTPCPQVSVSAEKYLIVEWYNFHLFCKRDSLHNKTDKNLY